MSFYTLPFPKQRMISSRSEGQVFDFFVKRSITCPRDLDSLFPLISANKEDGSAAGLTYHIYKGRISMEIYFVA